MIVRWLTQLASSGFAPSVTTGLALTFNGPKARDPAPPCSPIVLISQPKTASSQTPHLPTYLSTYLTSRPPMASNITGEMSLGLSWGHHAPTLPTGIASRVCITLGTVFPLLAYPFLEHREGWTGSYWPADTLLATSKNQLGIQALIIYSLAMNNFDDQTFPRIPVDAWPLYLGVFTFLASQSAAQFSKSNPLQPSDFRLAGQWACASLLYLLLCAFDAAFGCKPPYAFALAALVTRYICERLMEHVTKYHTPS